MFFILRIEYELWKNLKIIFMIVHFINFITLWHLLCRITSLCATAPVDNITEDTGLIPGRQYTYKAVLIQYGLQSDMSSECLTCPNPEEPVNLMAMPVDHESITVYFDAPEGRLGYNFDPV